MFGAGIVTGISSDTAQVTSRASPSCEKACCGGVMAGSWQSPSLSDPGRRDYVPDEEADCSYFSYSKSELIGKLLGEVRSGFEEAICRCKSRLYLL